MVEWYQGPCVYRSSLSLSHPLFHARALPNISLALTPLIRSCRGTIGVLYFRSRPQVLFLSRRRAVHTSLCPSLYPILSLVSPPVCFQYGLSCLFPLLRCYFVYCACFVYIPIPSILHPLVFPSKSLTLFLFHSLYLSLSLSSLYVHIQSLVCS